MSNGKTLPLMLTGCKVLDFTQYLAGPTVTRLMAEMGADIIKVEQAPMGDPSRLLPIIKSGRSAYFVQQNRGKKSLCLDLAKPEANDILRSLVAKVDIVVENYGPGVMKKMGFDYDSIRQINPRIIMASISAFGRSGPLAHKTGYDYIAQAFSGLMDMNGMPDGPPMFVGMALADVGSGVHAFAALGYALYNREKTGIGQYIDISMVDALYHMHDMNVQAYTTSDGAFVPKRMGMHHALLCPCGVFKTPQGWVFILVLDRQWANMAKSMGKPELIDDPRFATSADRAKNRDELNRIIQTWMLSFPSDEALFGVLEKYRIPSGPVLSVVDTINHPYFKARNMVRTVPDPVLGQVTIPGFPLKFSAYPDLPDIQAPLLGEHSADVLKEHLDYSDTQITGLRQKGVLYSENR
jgi:CoA:oxalate CoA-transferase